MAMNRGDEWEPRRGYQAPAATATPAAPSPPTLQPPANYRPVQYQQPQAQQGYGGYAGYGQVPQQGYQQPTQGYQQPAYSGYNYGQQTQPYTGWQPTQEFSDPTTANFENLLNYQAQRYMQPVSDPYRDQYAGMLQNMTGALGTNDAQFQQYMQTLQSILGEAGGSSPGEALLMSIAGSLAGGGNADAYADEYRKQLAQEPYTGAEWEAYRTSALEPIENDRAAAQQMALRRISQQGMAPTSGVALELQRGIDRDTDANRAAAQNQLAIQRVEDRTNRQGLAFQAGLSAEQVKNSAKSAGASAAGGAANAWSNRQGLRAGTAADLANAVPSRLALQLQPAQALSGLSANVRGEEDARYAQALQLSQALAQLPAQRQAEALAAMGMGESPSGVMNSLGQISGMNYQNQMASNASNANMQQGLGTLLGYLQPYLQQNTGTQYSDPGYTTNYMPFNTYGGYGNGGTYYPGG